MHDAGEVKTMLKRSLLFGSLDEQRLDTLATIAELRTFSKGKMIRNENDPADGMYVIGEGQVKVFREGPDGKEYIIRILSAGDAFSQAATLGLFKCPTSVLAMERTRTVFLHGEKLIQIVRNDNELCFQMLQTMCASWCQLVETVQTLVLRDSLGRLASYLLDHLAEEAKSPATVTLSIKKRDLAAYLALTPETLSRTLSRLAELGAIRQIEEGRIQLLDLQTLKHLSQA